MTTCLFDSSTSFYELETELRSKQSLPGILVSEPEAVEKEDLLLEKLGPKGWGRIGQFRHYLPGWGEGKGRVLSPRALEALYRFLESVDFPPNLKPSVFLTDRGGLELLWKEAEDQSVQIEFFSSGIELYRESTGEETELSLDSATELSSRIF